MRDFLSARFTQDPESGRMGIVLPFPIFAHSLGVGPSMPTFATIAFTVWGAGAGAVSLCVPSSVMALTRGVPLATGLV